MNIPMPLLGYESLFNFESINMGPVTTFVGDLCYIALGLVALWGAFCSILVWWRINQVRFRSEAEQTAFLDELDAPLASGNFDEVARLCEDDSRAIAQLAYIAVSNRRSGYAKVRALVVDRFQRDVLADIDHKLSWVFTVIKSAPMLGLFGTVLGMMGAFSKLAGGQKVEASQLADDISLALITTAIGLSIAIPLTLAVASINVRIRKMEDLVGAGLTRFLETFKVAMGRELASGADGSQRRPPVVTRPPEPAERSG